MNDRLARYREGLEYGVERYRDELEQANKALDAAQQQRDSCADNLAKAQALLDHERSRGGMELPLVAQAYIGLTPRDAALKALELAGRPLAPKEIIEKLETAGYRFESRFPGRSLHAALIGVDMVIKRPDGKLELIEVKRNGSSAPPSLALMLPEKR